MGSKLPIICTCNIEDGHEIKGTFIRTATKVGHANFAYEAIIDVTKILKVEVVPFLPSLLMEKKNYSVSK